MGNPVFLRVTPLHLFHAQQKLHLWKVTVPVCPTPNMTSKVLVSPAQALYAFYTLYQARGDQVSRYGYAAFGLTVLPYAVMSTIKLIGAFFTPTFDGLYLVQSDTLLEASGRAGANFVRVVGTLLPADGDPPSIPRLGQNILSGIVEPNGDADRAACASKIEFWRLLVRIFDKAECFFGAVS
jgi:hypothetical protein